MPNPYNPAAPRLSAPPAAGIVRRFLVWAQRAGARDRAEGASALARAYLHADLSAAVRGECVVALAALVDDPDVAVRRALAEAFAGERKAPRALVVALAGDQSEVAAPLLARSPLLGDAELVDCVAASDEAAQCAVARRVGLGPGPAAALIEVGARGAALVLIENPSAALAPGPLRRLMQRFGDDAEIRAALLARSDLPAWFEAEIVIATPGGPAGSARSAARRRAVRDAALVAIASGCPPVELPELVRTLRARGALTMALVLRSLLSGDRALFVTALAELSGLSATRAAGLVRDPHEGAFAAAASRAGLPAHALPVFRAALAEIASSRAKDGEGPRAELVGAAIAACEAEDDPALAPYLAFLWRLAGEAAEADSRRRPAQSLNSPPANEGAPTWVPALGAALSDRDDDLAPPVELPADLVPTLDAA